MKKLFTLVCAAVVTLTVSAQYQVQNSGFEEWDNEKTTSVEPAHWNSFMSGTGNMKSFAAAQQVAKNEDAHSGSYSARIYARSVFGVVAQGNLTTGCINMGSTNATDANGNYNYTNENDEAFHQKFTGLPDAMRVWVKASCQYKAGASCNLHTSGYFQDPEGNTITATRIAKANTAEIASSDNWQEVVIPFEYYVTDGTRPAYALITLTTSGTPGQGNASDAMLVDDVEMIYYSELSSVTFSGKEIAVTGSTINIDGTYDANLIQLKSNGHGASITTYYNEASKTLTISIKGDDISVNPGNQHTYTVIFSGKENEEPQPEPQPTIGDGFASLVPYGDFEAWKAHCGDTHQTGSGGGERQRPGIEPEGWNGNSVNMGVRFIATTDITEVLVEQVAGSDGSGSAVKLTNKSISYWGNSLTIPGAVSYANPWCWSGGTNFKNSDWGVYGGKEFTQRPDAIRGQFKRQSTDENAHIIAYLWKGTFKSKIGSYDDPSTETDDVERAIMGHATVTGGDGQLIAYCDHTFTGTADNGWETITVPLDYVEGMEAAVPEKMNIIISSGDYWSRSVKANNVLEADNIEFIFYSDLASATYDGKNIPFDENNHAVIGTAYKESLLNVTARGRGAKVNTSYDSATRVLTITVKGDNYTAENNNQNVYTLQFPFFSELASARYDGNALVFSNNAAEVDANYDESKLELTLTDDGATVEKSFNSTTRILTITVKAGNYAQDPSNVHTYTIHFLPQEKIISERTYSDQIQIKINEASNELQNASITLQEWNNGKTALVLKNFKMGSSNSPMYVGTIMVSDITIAEDGSFSTECNTPILEGDDPEGVQWLGPVLGDVPLSIEGKELRGRSVPDSLHVHIQIDLKERMGQFIDVLFGKSLIDGKDGESETPISGKIELPDHQDYDDDLTVTLNGNATAPQRTVISVDFHKNSNTLDLILKNFGLKEGDTDMPVGTIHVRNIPYTLKNGVPYATFNSNVTVAIEEGDDPNVPMWMGPMLGNIPLTLAGKAGKDKLYCTIDINMTGVGIIHVDFGTDANWPPVESGSEDPEPIENPILRDFVYTDVLKVTVNGESSSPEEAKVYMKVNDEGIFTLTIRNFYLTTEDGESLPIGNIEVSDIVPVEMNGKNLYLFETAQSIRIKEGDNDDELWAGAYLGEIPITMSGKIAQWKLYCNINIFLASMKQNVAVVFGENFTDGIKEINNEALDSSRMYNETFDISGRRINVSQMRKGLYIQGGKKILVK